MSSTEADGCAAGTSENATEEPTLTMVDVLAQEKEMEEEYAAVLGASDEKCCTYMQGPVKRQALYSCLTCCPEALNDLSKCAGICLACSYRCHENHELVELYTKRNFRCDCPTERFSGNRCLLNTFDEPQPRNVDNLYNQNFQGLYCTCHRPYPDPESTNEEAMLQCSICEDWYHFNHLDAPVKLDNTFSDVICKACMERHSFLQDYTGLALKSLEDANQSQTEINVTRDVSACEDNDNKLRSDLDKSISDIMNMSEAGGEPQKPAEEFENESKEMEEPPNKRQKLENDEEISTKDEVSSKENPTVDENPAASKTQLKNCRRPTSKVDYEKGATVWGSDWRAALCKCSDCMEMYKSQKVEFLLDAEDSSTCYEERGKKRAASESSYESGIRALASIGHVQQVDAIMEYNRMTEKLKKYLQVFAMNNKVVTEEDINRFFEEIRNEKNAEVGMQHFCR